MEVEPSAQGCSWGQEEGEAMGLPLPAWDQRHLSLSPSLSLSPPLTLFTSPSPSSSLSLFLSPFLALFPSLSPSLSLSYPTGHLWPALSNTKPHRCAWALIREGGRELRPPHTYTQQHPREPMQVHHCHNKYFISKHPLRKINK